MAWFNVPQPATPNADRAPGAAPIRPRRVPGGPRETDPRAEERDRRREERRRAHRPEDSVPADAPHMLDIEA